MLEVATQLLCFSAGDCSCPMAVTRSSVLTSIFTLHFLLLLFQKNPLKMWKGPMKQPVMLKSLLRSKRVEGTRTRVNGQVGFGPSFCLNPGKGEEQWSAELFPSTTAPQHCQRDVLSSEAFGCSFVTHSCGLSQVSDIPWAGLVGQSSLCSGTGPGWGGTAAG